MLIIEDWSRGVTMRVVNKTKGLCGYFISVIDNDTEEVFKLKVSEKEFAEIKVDDKVLVKATFVSNKNAREYTYGGKL